MAVIVKYVVVRDGKEDMIFTTKKEADAYDKMLDIAEQLHDFLRTAEIDITADQLDDLTFFMAQRRDEIGSILKGVAPEAAKKSRGAKDKVEAPPAMQSEVEEPAATEAQAAEAPVGSRSAKSRAAA
jgi:dsDNA-binding SOS-regulon protein